jgi:hypothetical protein
MAVLPLPRAGLGVQLGTKEQQHVLLIVFIIVPYIYEL